jgi:hypothetical protein
MDGPLLANLAAAGRLRRGAGTTARPVAPQPSGYPALDQLLGGGWPAGCLIELLVASAGTSELALLLPAFAPLSAAGQTVVLVAPPEVPYAPGWQQQGIDPHCLLLVDTARAPVPESASLWAMEEFLVADACGAVMTWSGRAARSALQRLQLAATASRALAILVRGTGCRGERSPAAVRLVASPRPAGLSLELLRNRFGATGRIELALA